MHACTLYHCDIVFSFLAEFVRITTLKESMSNMTHALQLCIVILLSVSLGQLVESYPYAAQYNNPRASKDNWKYQFQYNTQLDQSPPSQKRIKIASSNKENSGREDWSHRYQDYASEAEYYNSYDRKKLQAAETALILNDIAKTNARPSSKTPGNLTVEVYFSADQLKC